MPLNKEENMLICCEQINLKNEWLLGENYVWYVKRSYDNKLVHRNNIHH
jgi:hypothetical protein